MQHICSLYMRTVRSTCCAVVCVISRLPSFTPPINDEIDHSHRAVSSQPTYSIFTRFVLSCYSSQLVPASGTVMIVHDGPTVVWNRTTTTTKTRGKGALCSCNTIRCGSRTTTLLVPPAFSLSQFGAKILTLVNTLPLIPAAVQISASHHVPVIDQPLERLVSKRLGYKSLRRDVIKLVVLQWF